ncbi:hypothetical protein [Aliamphritea hakodatensis]|uniref:hypothetical protein n=1 Tax=Aliamphritea hakodatensis TaxID=2895352 RepID=UPI0022FD682C|nr:hypothetical protein [Aliamphritea hakodatensis]
MTTTIFRKKGKEAVIAADTRVSRMNHNGHIVSWNDVRSYLKCIKIGGALYGFAGTNRIFTAFLQEYSEVITDSNHVLDTLVEAAKEVGYQFYIMRYDGTLQVFAYSAPDPSRNQPEIKRTSNEPPINKSSFAIGSGQYSRMYKKFRTQGGAQLPIHKIITANLKAIQEQNLHDIATKANSVILDDDDAIKISLACDQHGGDLATGGHINMTNKQDNLKMERELVEQQVELLQALEKSASAAGLVCASPFDATEEAARLQKLGQEACSDHTPEQTDEFIALKQKLVNSIQVSY